VLVVGSGFGGFHAARELERRLPRRVAEIVLVSPDDHLTYGPLLPNVASGVCEPRHVIVGVHAGLRRTRHVAGVVESVDLAARTVAVEGLDGLRHELEWARLILSPGAVTRPSPVPGLAEHALNLKTLEDAINLRDHVIHQLDVADAIDDVEERRARCTFVVVGGGYTGAETAAQLHRFCNRGLSRFPRLRKDDIRWVLVDIADQVLPELGPKLGDRALRMLRRRGIDVRLGTTVEEVAESNVRLSDESTLDAYTVVWCAGLVSDPLVGRLGFHTVAGRVLVDATLRVPPSPDVYALGDAAAVPDLTRPGQFTPSTAQHAQRQGRAAARNVAASFGRGQERVYRHKDIGLVVEFSPVSAVAKPLGIPLTGLPAALVTRGYHLYALPSGSGRVRIVLDWLIDLFSRPQVVRVGRGTAGEKSIA
jgi:NADH dehydrogenase